LKAKMVGAAVGAAALHFDVERVSRRKNSIDHLFGAMGNGEAVKLLLHSGAEVDIRKANGHTPLHCAVSRMDFEAVRQLLDWGADLRARTNAGATPEDLSAYGGMTNMLRAVATRRARCEAFAMGHHERLGATSLLRGLDLEVLRIILEQA